jgi:hypothetical protein
LVAKAAGVVKAGTAAGGVLVAHLSISWAMDMQATIFHLDAALSALSKIHTTADKLEIELNFTKSALYNLETVIQLAGKRLQDLSRPSKTPLGFRASMVSFLKYLLMFLGILVYFPGLLDDDPEDLKQVREKGKIVVQICDSVNEKFQKLGLDIKSCGCTTLLKILLFMCSFAFVLYLAV